MLDKTRLDSIKKSIKMFLLLSNHLWTNGKVTKYHQFSKRFLGSFCDKDFHQGDFYNTDVYPNIFLDTNMDRK